MPRFLRAAWGDRETYDKAAEEIYAERYRSTAEAASRYYRDWLVHEAARGPHGRLKVPARLLYGTRDPLGAAGARDFERFGDDDQLIWLEGCGHFVPEERPGEVADAVRALAVL